MEVATPKKRSAEVIAAEACLRTMEAFNSLSPNAGNELRLWLEKYESNPSILPGTEEEFAKILKLAAEDQKSAVIFYRLLVGESSNAKRQWMDAPATPVSTAAGMRHVVDREYSVEGVEIPPHILLDKALDKIVEETERVSGTLDGTEPAPFVCLLQSSGYGKTRAVLQLAKTKRKIVYLMWKDAEKFPMPKVLEEMKKILDDANTDARRLLLWDKLLSAVEQCASLYENHKELFQAQTSGQFYTELENTLNKILSPASGIRFRKKDSTPAAIKQLQLPARGDTGQYFYQDAIKPSNDSLVVCLDEVTGLSESLYRTYRRVAKQRGVLSIFADTATSICKIVASNDHSSQQNSGKLGRFAKPLFALETTDIDLSVDERTKIADDDYENLFCAGRPRWRTQLDECKSIDQLLKLAENLLTQPKEEDTEDLQSLSKLDFPKAGEAECVSTSLIAVFACRFSLGRESRMAPLLVKHSLATVVGVSDDRSTVYTSYPSEPILAEVSARYTTDQRKRLEVLENVRGAFNNRTKLLDPPTGDVGEMCAAALLGYLMDTIRTSKSHQCMSQPVPLLDLLQYFGAKGDQPSKLARDWEVNFTHFIRPDDEPTGHHLEIMWKRRLAYYVPDGCDGLDLLVVIKKKCGNYGTLRIQVKNYSSKITTAEVSKILMKLLPEKCPPEVPDEQLSVGLLLCVGDVDARCDIVQYGSGKTLQAYRNGTAQETPRSSPRKAHTHEQKLLWLAAKFPSEHRDQIVKELAGALEQIARRHRTKEPDHTSKRFAKYYSRT